jgi:hypothetical protein
MKRKWEKDFEFLWGLAPPGTLKYKKGQEVLAFISKVEKEAYSAGKMTGSLDTVMKVRLWMSGKVVTKDRLKIFLNRFRDRIMLEMEEK